MISALPRFPMGDVSAFAKIVVIVKQIPQIPSCLSITGIGSVSVNCYRFFMSPDGLQTLHINVLLNQIKFQSFLLQLDYIYLVQHHNLNKPNHLSSNKKKSQSPRVTLTWIYFLFFQLFTHSKIVPLSSIFKL